MAVKAKVYAKKGDKVICKFFNIPDGKHYGDLWEGIVTKAEVHSFMIEGKLRGEFGYLVLPTDHNVRSYAMWMHANEIMRVIK